MNRPYIYDMNHVREQSAKELFKVVSCFAGGGGSSTGYRLAGGKVLAINEFIPEAQKAYAINYPDTHIFPQDIRLLTGQMILDQIGMKAGELDILDGSPPCAAFSMAGKREKGWGETKKYSDTEQRSDDLFFEFARILKEVQPKVFICENVKGIVMGESSNLLGSAQVSMFEEELPDTIFLALNKAGYNVRFKTLNSEHYGVPQSRERVIFIGVRKDLDVKITYPIHRGKSVSVFEAIHDLTEVGEWKKVPPSVNRVYQDLEYGESTYAYGNRTGDKMGGTQRHRSFKDRPCRTVTTKAEIYHYEEKRTLTIEECTRICSFPSDYYLGPKFDNRWERLGRAVPPLMMKAVAEHVYNTILTKI